MAKETKVDQNFIDDKKVVEEIMNRASQKASVPHIQVGDRSPDDIHNHPSNEDHLPGLKEFDYLEIPEFIDTGAPQPTRFRKPERYYRWVIESKILKWKTYGFRFVPYADCEGSGLWERTVDGRIRNGDLYMMSAPKRVWEMLKEQNLVRLQRQERSATEDLHNRGFREGVRTFEERDGVMVRN